MFNEILNTIKLSASKEIPISSKTKKIKPWATTTLIISIRKRGCLHSQVRKYPHNNQLKDYYLKYRNMITLLIRKAKKSYCRIKLQKVENYSKLKQRNFKSYTTDNKIIPTYKT